MKAKGFDKEPVTSPESHAKEVQDMISPRDRARATWVWKEKGFKEWNTATGPRILYLNSGELKSFPHTAASTFLFQYIETLQDNEAGFTLGWICQAAGNASAHHLTLNWLDQLFKHNTKLPLPDQDQKLDFRPAVDLLYTLLKTQLRKSSVFCFIDSISFYEIGSRMNDTKLLVDCLRKLAQEVAANEPEGAFHQFKVIITSATRCWSAGMLNDTDQVLKIPPHVPNYDDMWLRGRN